MVLYKINKVLSGKIHLNKPKFLELALKNYMTQFEFKQSV